MLADLLKDYNTVRVLEWLILHERWAQDIMSMSKEMGIVPSELRLILEHLFNYRLVFFDNFFCCISINTDNVILQPLRNLMVQLGISGLETCLTQKIF